MTDDTFMRLVLVVLCIPVIAAFVGVAWVGYIAMRRDRD